MGPYAALNTVFIGFFAFAAMLFALLWSQARRDTVLLVFAVHCAMCSILSASLYGVVAAQTPAEGQRALDMRVELAVLSQISVVWLVSLIADVRARWFVWSMTAVFLAAAFVNAAILPLAGSVTGVERIATPWGEQISILHRESPSRWLAPLYAMAISINVFGFIGAARLFRSDRVGGVLVATASGVNVVTVLFGARIDISGSPGLYLGPLPYAAWVLMVTIEIARDYRLRGDRLEESRAQLQRLTAGLLLAREEERTTIAREIHDVLGQTLTALKMDVAWVGRRVGDGTLAIGSKLEAMGTLIDDAVVTVRRIATALRPGVLDDLGLAAAVEWQAREFEHRTGIRCALRSTVDDGALDPLVSTAVFRIFQESLTNVARHSRASHVAVTLEQLDADLVLEVRDDGIGVTTADASSVRSIGLAGMRERAQLVGGGFTISGAAGVGTTVRVQIPWRHEATA
jgi:signal transduction histidine kinase